MAVKYNTQYNADGTSMGQDASEKVGFHGEAVVQASAIATLATTATDGPIVVALNRIITVLKNKGFTASS